MGFIILGLITYTLFFIFLPGVGTFSLRRKWGQFRNTVYRYSTLPRLSVCIDLKCQNIYTLHNGQEELVKNNWRNVSSIVEGTPFFIVGRLDYVGGIPFLVGDKKDPLLVLLHDSNSNIFEALIKKGRAKNDMWNSYSPYAYITGIFILIILSYFAYKSSYDKTNSFYLLVAAGTPFYFILPPGLIFYLMYRKLWDISIRLSVLRDLSKLKGKNLKMYKFNVMSKSREKWSLLFYLLGYIVNTLIAGFILFKMYQLLIYGF
ncbi:MAG: hypothetical protein B6229_07490 [Spirochaetaceae bacterium 4572_7]|nr:MAG: hypothetical protein B6229_07490 [Spirochaetaceae bacterium 4572_7]